jgi:DNA-binding FadR family transcriptional regulator
MEVNMSATLPAGPLARTSLHDYLTERLGSAIASGAIGPGASLSLDQLGVDYQVSRSVAREAVRVLASLGMVAMKRRVGILVLPMSRWNLFSPQIIGWRLASADRLAQFRSLTELRAAIEPQAARLAAGRAGLEQAGHLMGLAGSVWTHGRAGDVQAHLQADISFHRLVLAASGNEMFAAFAPVVAQILTSRTQVGLTPSQPDVAALQFHIDVATAIQRGDAATAGRAMNRIVDQALREMSAIWEGLPRGGQPAG